MSNRKPLHRLKRVAIIAAVLLVALVVAATLALRSSAITTRVTQRFLPAASEKLGRKIEIGKVGLGLWPPGVVLRDVQVEGFGHGPLLSAPVIRAQVALVPLLRSFGEDVRVTDVELIDTHAQLVRRRDGSWAHEELLKGQKSASPAKPTSERTVVIEEVRLRNGSLAVVDEGDGREPATLLKKVDFTARHVGPGEPSEVEWQVAIASGKQNVSGKLQVDRLPLAGELAAGRWPRVEGQLDARGLSLPALAGLLPPGLRASTRGGVLGAKATLSTRNDGRLQATGQASLQGLALRGHPTSGAFQFETNVDPSRPSSLRARIHGLRLNGPGVELGGTASYANARVAFDLAGPLLDLDALLGALPPGDKADEADEPTGTLSPAARALSQRLRVDGTLKLDKVVSGALTAEELVATAQLQRGGLVLTEGRANIYGGRVDLAGTRIDLREAQPRWTLAARVNGMDLGDAMRATTGQAPLTGLATAQLAFTGTGLAWDQVAPTVSGEGRLAVAEGALTGANLASQLTTSLTEQFDRVGLGMLGTKAPSLPLSGSTTPLQNLETSFRVEKGQLRLTRPLVMQSSLGRFSLTGTIGLDKQLALTGTVGLEPEIVAQLTGQKFRPRKPIAVPLQLGGTLEQPKIVGVDAAAFAQQLLTNEAVPQQLQEPLEEAKDRLRGLFPGF